tara:strand:- start:279 stop:602 length:324 start_codon:yes stop_codon:yes gene_type:complete
MPAGKIYDLNEDPQCEPSPEPSPTPERKLPEINSLDDIYMEMKRKGGIKIDNCNEIEIIRWAIWEAIKEEKVKEASLILFNTILNLANMFLIHYNSNKTTNDKLGIS